MASTKGSACSSTSSARSGGTGAFAWMVQSVVSDGSLADDSFRDMLRAAGEKNGFDAARVDELIRSAAAGQMDIPKPADTTEARTWLLEMAVAAMLTGGISKQEAKLIRTVGTRIGLVPADVSYVMNCARKEAFTQAKAELRTAKQERALGKSKS